jgi:AraC-like DNA-binding protein
MELLNREEHLGCYVYDNHGKSLISYMNIDKNEVSTLNFVSHQIVFLLEGKITYSYSNMLNKTFEASTFILFPAGYDILIQGEEKSKLLFINIYKRVNFCNHFPLELLYKLNQQNKTCKLNPCALKINEIIANYVNMLTQTNEDGLKCTYFHEIKQKELLFYLRAYYQKEDLLCFFFFFFNSDISFSEQIHQNIDKLKTVEEFAALTNYSIPGFKKRFVKVFGMPPYQWFTQERAKKIYHEINCTNKSFKKIAIDFNFSSPAHFNKFCKKVFGMTPSTIRENNHLNMRIN